MKSNSLIIKLILFTIIVLLLPNFSFAQKSKDKKKDKDEQKKESGVDEYQKQAEDLIHFLEGTLNAIGSQYTPVVEKQIMINDSYSKMFLDDKVQVEDDLDDKRQIYSYKDVQAYLQDIDFFFKNVKFEFKIESVENFTNSDGDIVFKFKTIRHLTGKTIDNDSMNNFIDRYIEINHNENNQSLKIVSMYTTKLNEDAETLKWWQSLSEEWKKILKAKSGISDPVNYEKLKAVLRITELDISNNDKVTSLEPLVKISKLKRLDCSYTKVNDLYPIRNLNKLEILNCSNTEITTIDPLQYATSLHDFFLDNTKIKDINVVENFTNLKKFSFENTAVSNIDALIESSQLEDLRMSGTKVDTIDVLNELGEIKFLRINAVPISNLNALSNLSKLEQLSFSATKIEDISILSKLPNLKVVYFNNTGVKDLKALEKNKKLEKIYCDNTGIDATKASTFMNILPNCLVIYNSDILKKWWEEMSPAWKAIFDEDLKTDNPTIEQLHRLSLKEEINLAGKSDIKILDPANKFIHLVSIDISGTGISDIAPLKNLVDLQTINCAKSKVTKLDALANLKRLVNLNFSNTGVADISPLANCDNLEIINADNTQIDIITALSKLSRLKKVYADNTKLTKETLADFKKENNTCLVVYRTEQLNKWWSDINDNWKSIFKRYVPFTDKPDREQLHQITVLKEIDVKEQNEISGLKPLEILEDLEVLKFTDTRINDLVAIKDLKNIRELICPRNPIDNLIPINNFRKLQVLDCSNTLISDLEPLKDIKSLTVLKISGTKVRGLKDIENLKELVHLDISATKVMLLKPVKELPKLKVLKCYNTNILKMFINSFKEEHPGCEVIN